MDEMRTLEIALSNCQKLEKSIHDSLKIVRRLNVRYNSDNLLRNYRMYVSNLWVHYVGKLPDKTTDAAKFVIPLQHKLKLVKNAGPPANIRSSKELVGSSDKIKYIIIKIKRSVEAILMQIKRAIVIAERQRNYTHVGLDAHSRVCCH